MAVIIPKSVHDQLLKLAAATPDVEVCGLLFGTPGHITAFQPTRNVAKRPETRFEIDPKALIAAHKAAREGGNAIIGHYHSHPNGLAELSETDSAMASPGEGVWLIITSGVITAWRAGRVGLHDRFVPAMLLIRDEQAA
jgi:desampylase